MRLSGALEKEEERRGRQRGGVLPNMARPATPAAVLKYNKVKLIFTPQSKTNNTQPRYTTLRTILGRRNSLAAVGAPSHPELTLHGAGLLGGGGWREDRVRVQL